MVLSIGPGSNGEQTGRYKRLREMWFVEHAFVFVPAQAIVAQHLDSFREFPPRQAPGSFTVNQVMERTCGGSAGIRHPPTSAELRGMKGNS